MAPPTPIYVISMTNALDRRRRMTKIMEAQTRPWQFVDATVGQGGLAYDPAQSVRTCGRLLREGEQGCFASHYAVWKTIVDSGHSQALVLEDDVFVDWPALAPFLQHDFNQCADYLRFSSKRLPLTKELGWLYERRIYQHLGYSYGTQGYLLTTRGAARFLKAAVCIDRPVDDFMDRAWSHGVETLAVFPPVIIELCVPSTIGSGRLKASHARDTFHSGRLLARSVDKMQRLLHTARELSPLTVVRPCSLGITSNRQ